MDIQLLGDNIINLISDCKQPLEMLDDITSDISSGYNLYKSLVDIPTKFYMYKYKLFCKGIQNIRAEDGEAYIDYIGEEKVKKESYILLEIIARIEEEKLNYIICIFKARVKLRLSDNEYRRLLIYVSQTLYSDLEYMRKNLTSNLVVIDCEELEGLYKSGWLIVTPPGKQYINSESKLCCFYIELAKKLSDIMVENLQKG